MAEITEADVQAAQARLAEAKATYRASAQTAEDQRTFADVKAEVNALRMAYRQQEVAAGRRLGMVGGEADEEGA